MEQKDLQRYRQRLTDLLSDLETQDDLGRDGQRTVELDQQSVGRLSRMDALQSQAMARAQQARRNAMRQRIAAALARIDQGEFGYCTECGEPIAPARLDLDATIPLCVNCARGT